MEDKDPFAQLDAAQHAANAARVADQAGQPYSADLIIYLSTSILAVTALALILGSLLLWKRAHSGQEVLRLYGVVIIVGLSTLLLVVGYSNAQLTPIVGLFGAIAGYLLGKETRPAREGE
jgi:hypothetical protein